MTAPPAGALEACPFCGSPAEIDTAQAFRALVSGRMEKSVAIYCTSCTVQMQHCYSDHAGVDREALREDLVAAWNRRTHGPALLAALRLREWRPIETAPKDGTRVLVFGEFAGEIGGPVGEMAIGVAAWMYGGSTDYAGYHWRAENTDAYSGWWRPTHWMPLPAPPTTDDLARVLEESATGDEAGSA